VSDTDDKIPALRPSLQPTYEELVQLVGDLEPARLAAIETLGATIAEVEEAVAYAAGEDDVMGEARLPLIGRAAAVYEIIVADEAYGDER
jgi:hypothetical protein